MRSRALQPAWQDLIGREISLLDLYGVATKITRQYRNDGYVLSRALVPAQRIEGGVVRLDVIEGYVGRVTIRGEVSRESLLRGYADKITGSRPLQIRELERYLLLMDDLAGATVSSVLEPLPGETGAAELTIEMSQKMVDMFGTMDNRGTRYIGPFQSSLGGRLNSALGFYELTPASPDRHPGVHRRAEGAGLQPCGADRYRGQLADLRLQPGRGASRLHLEAAARRQHRHGGQRHLEPSGDPAARRESDLLRRLRRDRPAYRPVQRRRAAAQRPHPDDPGRCGV
ncbi:MAG: POTRA domain-containing protein [Pseudomonadota bacterium]